LPLYEYGQRPAVNKGENMATKIAKIEKGTWVTWQDERSQLQWTGVVEGFGKLVDGTDVYKVRVPGTGDAGMVEFVRVSRCAEVRPTLARSVCSHCRY
jgi:hypothetical protein